jgi:hypothetical protein
VFFGGGGGKNQQKKIEAFEHPTLWEIFAPLRCAELRFAPVPRRGFISTERSELMNTFIKKYKVNNKKTVALSFPIGFAELRFAPIPCRGFISTERSELMNTFIKKIHCCPLKGKKRHNLFVTD